MEKNIVNKTVNKIERSAYPSNRIYALTFSSNCATHKNAYDQYEYVIAQLPKGTFNYVYEKSGKGKYHVHGIMRFKQKFNYFNLKESLVTRDGRQFDIHIQYKMVQSDEDHARWYLYCSKQEPQWRTKTIDPEDIVVKKIPIGCIPEVTLIQVVKPLRIPGIY